MRQHSTVTIVLLILTITSLALVHQTGHRSLPSSLAPVQAVDSLGRVDGPGVPGNLSYSGDGQRLLNSSFENGLGQWTQTNSNTANGSATTLTGPGYQDSTSLRLSVYSGNSSALSLSSDSTVSMTNDLSTQRISFNTGTRFRIAVQTETLTGRTAHDMVEVALVLSASTGNVRTIHYLVAQGGNATAPPTTSNDAYLRVQGFGTLGQWVIADRNLGSDALAVFSDAASIDSVQSISLRVHSQSLPGSQNIDAHIRYWDSAGFGQWAFGEPVVHDTNNNGAYDSGEPVIGCGYPNTCSPPPQGTTLSTDPKMKFVDQNHDRLWNCTTTTSSICTNGELVAYDNDFTLPSGDGIYDYGEPIINVPPAASFPIPGTLLERVVQGTTLALFDNVELYTASAGYDWVKNGGFEAGLSSWYASGFTSVTSPVHSGLLSAQASVSGNSAELDQSIDARPQLDASTSFKASVNIQTFTGSSAADSVDLWLGLDDSHGNSLALYYYFKTGTGTIPANRTDTITIKASGFGTVLQWLNINENLQQRIQSAVQSNSLPYKGPYTIELVVLEATASSSILTNAIFDDISLRTPYQVGPAPSHFFSVDSLNTTYLYTAASIPQGAFSIGIPLGRSILNVTSPEGTILQPGEYSTSSSSGHETITVPDSTSSKHAPIGDWKFYTTSNNGVARVYVEDPVTRAPLANVKLNSTVNLVSLSQNPFGQPLQNVQVNLTLWDHNGVRVGSGWSGLTNSRGWFNVSSIILPLGGTSLGIYSLEAEATSNLYPGVKTVQVAVGISVPSLGITPTSGPSGTLARLQGTGFPRPVNGNSSIIQITFDDILVGFAQFNSGSFTFDLTIPQVQIGSHIIKAVDVSTGVSATTTFQVIPRPHHDVAIVAVQEIPHTVISGQTVSIYISLVNYGNNSEIVDLTAYYDSHVAGSLAGVNFTNYQTFIIYWDTSGVPAGNYTISAAAFLASDENPSNNSVSDGTVTVLPPPTLTTTPTSGPVGTQVQLQGSGFPQPLYGSTSILVSFDDQFMGFTTANNGQFSFTFNVPLAQPGSHNIKAYDQTEGLLATSTFQVTIAQPQTSLAVTATVGAIYFPGDTAVITVQAKLDGQLAPGASLRVIVVRPDGSNATLNLTQAGTGQWKANYLIPTKGSFGTYEVIVKAHQTGSLDGTTLASFEVKPTWIQGHISTIAGTIALVGMVGLVAVAWRRGYFVRKKDELAQPTREYTANEDANL